MAYSPGQGWHYGPHCHQGIGRLLSKYRLHSVPPTCNQRGTLARWPTVHWREGGVGSLGCSLGVRSAAPASIPTRWDGTYSILQKLPVPSWDRGNRVGREYALCYVNWGWNLYSVDHRPYLLICEVSAIIKLHCRLLGAINGGAVDKEVDAQ